MVGIEAVARLHVEGVRASSVLVGMRESVSAAAVKKDRIASGQAWSCRRSIAADEARTTSDEEMKI